MSAGVHGRHRRSPAADFAVAAVACLVLAAAPRGAARGAFAFDGGIPDAVGVLSVAPRVVLEAISASELTPGPGAGEVVDLGRWRGPEGGFELPPLQTEITRRIPALWRLRVDDSAPMATLDVRYEVVALNGRAGRLSHVDHPEAEIGARAEPLTPDVLGRDGGTVVLEGGMILILRLGETRYAGSYAGTVTVTVHQL
jgi:hypothetical protein